MTLETTQILVLCCYFAGIYAYKFFVEGSFLEDQTKAVMRGMIPAINLIAGLILGSFGLADFDMTVAVLGTLATGGAADLLKMPTSIKKKLNE